MQQSSSAQYYWFIHKQIIAASLVNKKHKWHDAWYKANYQPFCKLKMWNGKYLMKSCTIKTVNIHMYHEKFARNRHWNWTSSIWGYIYKYRYIFWRFLGCRSGSQARLRRVRIMMKPTQDRKCKRASRCFQDIAKTGEITTLTAPYRTPAHRRASTRTVLMRRLLNFYRWGSLRSTDGRKQVSCKVCNVEIFRQFLCQAGAWFRIFLSHESVISLKSIEVLTSILF